MLCGTSLFLLLGANLIQDWNRWGLGAFAVLYNPIIPIYLRQKGLWIVLNIPTIALFWVVTTRERSGPLTLTLTLRLVEAGDSNRRPPRCERLRKEW